MGKLKTLWRAARQTFFVFLITLFLAEIAFRLYNYIHPSFVFYDSSYNRFRGKPNAPDYDFHLNSRGFKDVEFNTQKADGTYRILGLGDSFAFAVVPYQFSYLTLLEENLNRSGNKTELINMGIAGAGPADYLALLVNEGLELKPDMVIVSFFIGNDFVEEKKERKLYTYSYAASFINYLIMVNKGFDGQILHPNRVYDETAPTFSDPVFIALESERSEIYRKQSKEFEGNLARALSYLVQIKQQCDAHQIALAVALLPDEVQVNPALQSKVCEVKAFNSSAEQFDFTLPNRLLVAQLREQNIAVLDLLDDFSRASTLTALYKPNDTHWNTAGNRLAADLIARELFHLAPSATAAEPSTNTRLSVYEGFHDEADCRSIKGWAWDASRPNEPVEVELYDGARLVVTTTANLFRSDLLAAGKGNGAHAFVCPVPAQLKDGKEHPIRVKIAGTERALNGTPKPIRCPAD